MRFNKQLEHENLVRKYLISELLSANHFKRETRFLTASLVSESQESMPRLFMTSTSGLANSGAVR